MAIATTTDATSAVDVLEEVRRLAPDIAARAEEIEASRRVPRDLLERLQGAGCFGFLLPRSHGGAEADLPTTLQVLEELARADASVGWRVMIGAGIWLDLAELPRATFDAVFGGGDALVAGVFNPTGMAVPVDGGYRADGRWAFASGCEDCDWVFGNCVDASGDEPRLRITLFRREEVVIEDTWSVAGLCGTGSHHMAAHDVVVPAERTALLFVDPPCVDSPLLRIGTPGVAGLGIASVAVGVAQGALDDIVALANDKVPLLAGAPLAANPLFQHRLAQADVELRAARSLLQAEAAAGWAAAEAGDELTPALRARLRSAGVWATTTAAGVVDAAYLAGGGSALYASSPLQRRLRDVHVITQHFLVKPDTLTTVGAVLAGQDPDLTIF